MEVKSRRPTSTNSPRTGYASPNSTTLPSAIPPEPSSLPETTPIPLGTTKWSTGPPSEKFSDPLGTALSFPESGTKYPCPRTRGFDRYYGLADGCSNFFNPGLKARPGEGPPGRKGKTRVRRWAIEDKVIMGYTSPDKKFYHTDAFTNYAIDRLDEYKDEDKPFVLYLPYTAPHYPLHAWPEDIAKYRGKYKIGWDEIREQRFKRMNEMGIIGPNHKLTPRASKAWDDLTDEQKDAEDLKMAVYAAMIDRVDQNLGRLFAKVKELGEWDNTLIMFLTDNGACPEQPNTTPNIPPGPVESYRTVSVGWANASNTPYRKFKSTDYEGGIRTPFIAHWPGVIKPGMTNQVGHIIDVSATFRDITGAKYPKEILGNKTKPPLGKSLLPILKGEEREPHKEIYWHFNRANAVRQGDLKVVRSGQGMGTLRPEGRPHGDEQPG